MESTFCIYFKRNIDKEKGYSEKEGRQGGRKKGRREGKQGGKGSKALASSRVLRAGWYMCRECYKNDQFLKNFSPL